MLCVVFVCVRVRECVWGVGETGGGRQVGRRKVHFVSDLYGFGMSIYVYDCTRTYVRMIYVYIYICKHIYIIHVYIYIYMYIYMIYVYI